MKTSRRLFVQGALPLLTAARASFAQASDAHSVLEARISRIIEAYSAQGEHRTGTAVDAASAGWLAKEIENLGIKASLPTFEFNRFVADQADIRWGAYQVEGLPLYDGGLTGPGGVTAVAGEINGPAEIGVVTLFPFPADPGLQALQQARLANRHRAVVVVTDPSLPPDGVAALNADEFNRPYGPPVLQIPYAHWHDLKQAIAEQKKITVTVHAHRVATKAMNVQAEIAGRDPDLAPVVVMTPRSGWSICASERGGGIAAFLEIMRSFGEAPPLRRVIFTANSGHELGHLGLDQFLHDNPGLVRAAHVWVHLGANFAAAHGREVWLQYSSEDWRRKLLDFVKVEALSPDKDVPVDAKPLGEAKNIAEEKGAYVSILGRNGLFHHPADRWPAAVDVVTAARWTRAFTAFAQVAANEA